MTGFGQNPAIAENLPKNLSGAHLGSGRRKKGAEAARAHVMTPAWLLGKGAFK
jgi:hypothetical protein